MKLTPPKVITWWVAVILGALALLGYFKSVAALTPYAFLARHGRAHLACHCYAR